MTSKFIIHYGFHFIVPLLIAFVFFRTNYLKVYALFVAAMIIDLDHLLATPIFQENRCSINFHPLHTYYAITVYIGFLFFKKVRIIGIGLLLHIIADTIDCML